MSENRESTINLRELIINHLNFQETFKSVEQDLIHLFCSGESTEVHLKKEELTTVISNFLSLLRRVIRMCLPDTSFDKEILAEINEELDHSNSIVQIISDHIERLLNNGQLDDIGKELIYYADILIRNTPVKLLKKLEDESVLFLDQLLLETSTTLSDIDQKEIIPSVLDKLKKKALKYFSKRIKDRRRIQKTYALLDKSGAISVDNSKFLAKNADIIRLAFTNHSKYDEYVPSCFRSKSDYDYVINTFTNYFVFNKVVPQINPIPIIKGNFNRLDRSLKEIHKNLSHKPFNLDKEYHHIILSLFPARYHHDLNDIRDKIGKITI